MLHKKQSCEFYGFSSFKNFYFYQSNPLFSFYTMPIYTVILQKILYRILLISGWKRKVLFFNLDYIYPKISLHQKRTFRKKLLQNLSFDVADFLTRNCIYSSNDKRFQIDSQSIPVLEKMKNGGLMLTAHFGNYEAIGPWLVRLGIPLTASYAKLHPECLNRWVYKHLRSIDNFNYSHFINNPRDILQFLNEKKLFCLIADQDFRKNRFILGKLLKKPVHCNPIPQFILNHRPKLPIFICWIYPQNHKHILFAKEIYPQNGQELFEMYHQWLEFQIQIAPERWYGWLHRRYLSALNDESKK